MSGQPQLMADVPFHKVPSCEVPFGNPECCSRQGLGHVSKWVVPNPGEKNKSSS